MAKNKNKKVTTETLQDLYQTCPRATFFRRLGAYTYDLFAIAAVLMVAGIFAILMVMLGAKIGLISLEGYQDVAAYLSESTVFAAYLGLVIIGFYGYFWTKAGQTLGMKAWRLRVQNSDGSNISLTQAVIRMATSAFGLGNIMALFTDRNAFQDLWGECEVVVLTKEMSNWKGFKGMGFMDLDKK
ncbi:MAG: RDD family protein [Psychromonas sp.]